MARSGLIVAKDLIANKGLSMTARLLFGFLLDHRNKKTGQCNPRRQTLARELGIDNGRDQGRRRISRALAELRAAGFVTSKQGQHANFYDFRVDTLVNPEHVQGGQMRQPPLDRFVNPGPPYPLYEPIQLEQCVRARSAPPAAPPRKSIQSETLERYYAEERRKAGAQ